jgi:hypothetical protein
MVVSSPDGAVRGSALVAVAAAPAGALPVTAVSPAAETAVTTRTHKDLRAVDAVRARAEVTRFPSDFIASPPSPDTYVTPQPRQRHLVMISADKVSPNPTFLAGDQTWRVARP